jgi:hypothetical protein
MNNHNALLVAAIPGAFITFDPSSAAAGPTAQASASSAKKGACGKCTLCRCKRAKG